MSIQLHFFFSISCSHRKSLLTQLESLITGINYSLVLTAGPEWFKNVLSNLSHLQVVFTIGYNGTLRPFVFDLLSFSIIMVFLSVFVYFSDSF